MNEYSKNVKLQSIELVETTYTENFKYTANLNFNSLVNVNTYDVYLNDYFYGSNMSTIQITTGDTLRLEVTPVDNTKSSSIVYISTLI